LLTAPAPQSLELLAGCADRLPTSFVAALRSIVFDPCLAVMVSLAGQSRIPLPGYVRPEEGPVAFIADNRQKGISPRETALTIHGSPSFSRSYIHGDRDEGVAALVEAASPWFGSPVVNLQAHFWKDSQPVGTWHEPFLFTADPAPLAVAGDAFANPRIEGAFLSGLAAAQQIITE